MDTIASIIASVIAAVVPTLAMFLFQHTYKKNDERREKKAEQAREERRQADARHQEWEGHILQSVNASLALGEATAEAIKTGKANGEVTAALKYAQDVKHGQRDFLAKQGIKNIYACKGETA